MKKLICLLVLVTVLTTLLTGCLGQFECDLCGDEQFGVFYETEILGKTVEYCGDCKDDIDEFKNNMEEFKTGLDDLKEGLSGLFG